MWYIRHEVVSEEGDEAPGRLVTPWHRVKDFQLITLKALAPATLRLGGPAGHPNKDLRFEDLYVSGELSRRLLHFGKQITLHASPHNPGAREAAEALGAAMGSQLLVTDGTDHKAPTHFLLYLAHETFVGNTVVRNAIVRLLFHMMQLRNYLPI